MSDAESITVGIVGMGHVGLPLAVAFAEAGEQVICVDVDVDVDRISQLRAGESYLEDIPSDRLRAVAANLEPTTSVSRLALADAIVVCVPTPLTANREPDLGPLTSAVGALSDVVRAGQLVVLESTTYPGTTRERVLPLLEQSGLRAGLDLHVAFSPERVDPGRTDHTLRTTPKIVAGLTAGCRARAEELYRLVCDQVVPVSTLEVAEMAKLLENIFRSVNIALVNELGMLADRMSIDIWEVVDAASTKPFGFMRFEPGPGLGGHCLPVDPFHLSSRARELDVATKFIELAGRVNQSMPQYCVQKVERALNDAGKPTRGSKVLVLGVAYKPAVSDVRESPAVKIITRLQQVGAHVVYHDPYVPDLPGQGLSSLDLDQAMAEADLAVIVTAHPGVDHIAIARKVQVVDLRGVTRPPRVKPTRDGTRFSRSSASASITERKAA